ncbi:hypothetical protein AHAS_Ahas18G0096000 [Arachis hypogaea]
MEWWRPKTYNFHFLNIVAHIPPGADVATLRKYTICYLLILIERYLFTDKSANLVSLRWLPLLANFDSCRWLS